MSYLGAQGQNVAVLHVLGRIAHDGKPLPALEILEEQVVADGLAVGCRLQPNQEDLLGSQLLHLEDQMQ